MSTGNGGTLRVAFATLILLGMNLSVAFAQLPTATILGVVKDSSGAVVPDATVTATNVETGQKRTVSAAGEGSYRVSALPVGSYEVRVEHAGFQAGVRSGLTLTVGQEAVVNVTLEVGSVGQAVTVSADAPLVNTTSGSLGGLVSQDKIADLPLNGRNYIDLTLLQPGISPRVITQVASGTLGSFYSSNGATPYSNYYMLDGAPAMGFFGATTASFTGSTLGVDGIREYRVITNSFSAEYGMRMGSQVVMVSKGGTNAFHGSAFEFLRNSALDARNFYDYITPTTPRRLPAFTRNNFGGSFGGPIRKDKTFFFAVYEGLQEHKGVTTVSSVMGAGCKGAGGATITNAACPQLGATPSVTVAPIISAWLPLFPNPNLPNNQYTFPFGQPSTDNYGQIRLDQNFSPNDTFFGRYTVDDAQVIAPFAYPQYQRDGVSRSQLATLSDTHVFSPTLLNTLRFSYSRSKIGSSPADLSQQTGPQFALMPGQALGILNVAGLTTLTPVAIDSTPGLDKHNIFTWSDDAFYTRGRHALKFGALINHFQQFFTSGTGARGSVNFANLATFLQGLPTSYTARSPGSFFDRTYHFSTLGFYAQDDIQLSPTLVINLGLRYEFMTQMNEAQGNGSSLRDPLHDTAFTPGPTFKNPSLGSVGPRFGFAWDPEKNGRTVVRGGFALMYDIGNYIAGMIGLPIGQPPITVTNLYNNPPNLTLPLSFPAGAASTTVFTMQYNMKQAKIYQYNLTLERQLPFEIHATLSYAGSRALNLMQVKQGDPTVPQILPDGREFWTGNESRINPVWGSVNLRGTGGNSWYNALEFSLNKRLAHGLQFQSSYTWSKALDENTLMNDTEATGTAPILMDGNHPGLDRAPADFDLTQNWRTNAIYNFPSLAGGGALAKILNGWWMSGILSLQSGFPFTPALSSNRSRSQVLGGTSLPTSIDRPDLVPGRNGSNIVSGTSAGCQGVAAGTPLGTPTLYYDPCAFTIPAAGFLGTGGRNILRSPALANLDFSIVKDTRLSFLGEGGKLELRAEMFNLLNHPYFGLPSRVVYAALANQENPLPTAGKITSTIGASRQIQFGLKIVF